MLSPLTPHIVLETHRARQLKAGTYFSKTVGCCVCVLIGCLHGTHDSVGSFDIVRWYITACTYKVLRRQDECSALHPGLVTPRIEPLVLTAGGSERLEKCEEKVLVHWAYLFTKHYYLMGFWCRIHLWFRLMGGLHAKSMTSQRYRTTYKMADMRYYGNVMTTTRWRLYIILHLQQYNRRLTLFFFLPGCFRCFQNNSITDITPR